MGHVVHHLGNGNITTLELVEIDPADLMSAFGRRLGGDENSIGRGGRRSVIRYVGRHGVDCQEREDENTKDLEVGSLFDGDFLVGSKIEIDT